MNNELDLLKKVIKMEMFKKGYDNRKLAHELNISEGLMCECINFRTRGNGCLRGSLHVWQEMEKILNIDIITTLRNLGLRKK